VRKEEVEQVNRLRAMDGMNVLEGPETIAELFKKQFG
jgi:flavoprotein